MFIRKSEYDALKGDIQDLKDELELKNDEIERSYKNIDMVKIGYDKNLEEQIRLRKDAEHQADMKMDIRLQKYRDDISMRLINADIDRAEAEAVAKQMGNRISDLKETVSNLSGIIAEISKNLGVSVLK